MLHPLLKQKKEAATISWREKDIISSISSHHYMIVTTGKVNSWFAWHGEILKKNSKKSTLIRILLTRI